MIVLISIIRLSHRGETRSTATRRLCSYASRQGIAFHINPVRAQLTDEKRTCQYT